MLARDFDPLIYYEDLSGDAVKSVVEVFNREVEELVGGLARIHYERLLDYLKNPRVTSATLIKDGVVAIYRGLRDEVVLLKDGRRVTLHSSSDEIPSSVERVKGSDSLVAINYSIMGADESRVYIVDVSGKPLYVLEGVVSDFAIKEETLYYVRSYRDIKPPDGGGTPTDRVVKLVNGEERVVWGGGFVGDGELIGIVYSPDLRRALVLVYRGWSRSRLYLVDLDSGSSELLEGGDYSVILAGWGKDYVYIRRKAEGMEVVVGGRAFKVDRPIDNAIATGDKLLLVENVSASHRVKVYNLESMEFHEPLKGERFTVLSVDGFNGRFLLHRTSFAKSYSLDLVDGSSVKTVDEGVTVKDAATLDLWIEGHDGVKIHGFLISKGGNVKGVILYGYGGFAQSQMPKYTFTYHYLLDLGYAIAIANIRGGGEEGEWWHRAGMLKNKENTFKDFASFARFFKSLGLKVVGFGTSNGGLTVGAVITKWPELLDAAVIGYPVLDMLRYHKLYVGKYWIPEYGDPEDPEMREYLLSYSPYHNIPRDKKLPPTLVYTGIHDDRVHPAHAIKFTVKAKLLGHPVYLRVETRSGHRGAQPQIAILESAYIIAFIEQLLNPQSAKTLPT
jgi:prolyl oligopeptidase